MKASGDLKSAEVDITDADTKQRIGSLFVSTSVVDSFNHLLRAVK